MAYCPNKNLEEWELLVSSRGEDIAYYLWDKYEGNVPEIESKQSIVKAGLKAIQILNSDKAKQIFDKGNKNNWSLEKILDELAVPREQRELIKGLGKTNLNEIVTDLLANYSYTVEINTATKLRQVKALKNDETVIRINGQTYKDLGDKTDYYSNLTVPGGTNYAENEIATPAITPSIKGHAQFSTDNGIGWFRSDDEIPYKVKDKANGDINTLITKRTPTKEEKEIGFNTIFKVKGSNRIFRTKEEAIELANSIRYDQSKGIFESKKSTKTRRILEVQSDLFQKGRERTDLVTKAEEGTIKENKEAVDYLGELVEYEGEKWDVSDVEFENSNYLEDDDYSEQTKVAKLWLTQGSPDGDFFKSKYAYLGEVKRLTKTIKNEPKNQFLQLLNKNNNWVTFFIKSIIQDSAKKGYEKVLFPTSEVVSKIQKFDEASKKYSNAISKLEKDRTSEDNFIISEWEKDSTKKTIKGTLDFYNNLRNTLDDLVGGNKNDRKKGIYKLTQVTDEYGNTWNEITINQARDLANILFGLNTQNQEQLEFHINTLNVVSKFLENVGVRQRLVSEFLSQDGSIVDGALAAANFIEGTVDIIDDLNNGRAKAWNKLPEEASHWWYRLLNENSPLKKALWESHQTALKNDELYKTQYGKLVKSPSDLTEESIGQLIAEAIKRIETKNGNASDYSFFKKFLEWINSIIDTFKKTTQDPFEVAAMKILSSDMSDLMTWEEYRKLNNIVNFADVVTEQSVAPLDYTLLTELGELYVGNVNNEKNVSYNFRRNDGISSPYFSSQEELDNWVYKTYGKEYNKRQKQILQEVRDNQVFFDRLLNKSFRKKSKFLSKTLRKYFDIIDAQNLNPLSKWNISQELQQITKKLTPEEKRQIVETNGYTNIAPTLKVLPDLLQKYRKNPIVLSQPIKIDGAKKQELSILNGIREMIKLENPNLKSITAEEFVAEAHNWLETNYLLGFANENAFLSYRTDQTFQYLSDRQTNEDVDITNLTEEEIQRLPLSERQRIANIVGLTKQNPDVYHNKISLRFNDMYHLKSGHFSNSPSAWGNLTYFYTGKNKWKDAVLLHEIQNDNIEFLREYKSEKVDLETSLSRYLQQLNTDLLDNITQIESGGKQIIKKDSSEEFRKTHLKLNYQLLQLKDLPLEQGLSQLKQILNEQIELYKSDPSNNIDKAQEVVDGAYSRRRIFQDFQKRGGIKSLLTKEELQDLEDILKRLNTEEVETATWSADENAYFPDLGVRDLKQKKRDFSNAVIAIQTKINDKLRDMYGDNIPLINLTAPAKPRTKSQIRQGVQKSQELNENVNWLLSYSEKKILDKLSKNIEGSKRNYIQARNATTANNFNVQLSKITLEQWTNLVENYTYNQNLLTRLIDEQAQKDIKAQSSEINPEDNPLITSQFYKTLSPTNLPSDSEVYTGNEFHFGTWEFGYGTIWTSEKFPNNLYIEISNSNIGVIKKSDLKDAIIKSNTKEGRKKEQQSHFEKLKQKALDKKAELEKNYGKIEEEVKQTLEIEMNYFTPLVHHLIQKHINQYGKDFPMYFSGYQITKLTQGNDRTAWIYAGKDEVNIVDYTFEINNKKYETGLVDVNNKPIAYKITNTKDKQVEYWVWKNYNTQTKEYQYEKYVKGQKEKDIITEQEYNKVKQEYEKAYQQATERRAKEIKVQAAQELGLFPTASVEKLSDEKLNGGIKALNEFKKIPKSDPRSKYNYKSNADVVIEKLLEINNKKPIETGAIYNAMSQVSGIKLIWQDKIEGLQKNAGGYLVDLSNYNYNTPILYGLNTSKVVPINPNRADNSEIQYSKKQGYNPTEITDEYGNTWTEVNLDESHLDTIHFQKAQGVQSFDEQTAKEVASVLQEVYPEISLEYTELEGLRGQANIKAGKVLIDSLNQNTDTLAHEYAHHYISWFKNSPIVQKGIRLFGSEEALVQTIGEQAVVQKAKANIWYRQFWNWIKSLFNNKQAQLERLTDSFLERKTLGEKQVRNVTHNQAVDPNSIKSDEKLIKTIDAAKLVFKNRQAELKQQYGEERAGTRESIKRIRAALEKLTEQATYSDILSVAKAQLDVARNALDKPFNEMSDADFVDVKKILYFTDEFDKLLLNAPEDEAFNRQVTQVRAETIRLQNKFDKFIKQRLVEASKAYGREITPEELEKAYDDLSTAKAMTMSLETTRIPHLQFAAAVMNWRSRQTDLEVNQFDREYRDLVKKYSEEEFKKIFDAKGHLISMYSHDFYNAQAEVYRNLRKLNDSSTKEDWMNAKREIGEWFEQNYTYKLTPEGKALFEKHLKEVEEANTFDGEVNQDAVEKFKQQYSWENKGVVNPDGSFTITKDGIPRSNIGGTNIYSDKWYAYLVKTPLEKYKNPDFEKVRDLEVYNWYVDKVQDIYSKTSPTLTSELGMYDNVIHQTKLDLTESKFQLGNTLKGIKESALDWVTVSLTYHQLNETLPNLTDEKGRPKPLIRPKSLYEIQREGQFKDPIDLLRKGFEMAVTYEHKLEIQPLLELVGYQLEKTKKIEKNPITDKIRKDLNKNPLETAGMLTKAIGAFKFRENAELTGQTRTDETSGILRDVTDEEKEQLRKDYEEWYEGGKIGPEPVLKKQSWIKYSDAVVDFTRLNLIGLKPFSALANVSIGMINNYVYAAREKDFNTKDLDWAMIKLRNSMLRFGTVNLVTNKEAMKIGSLALKFGVIKETFIEDSKEYGKNKYLKMIPQVLFLLQESGEYLIANQILLAKLHNTKIKNLAGKEKNLYEAFDEFGDWKTSEFGEAPEWNKLVHLNESGENISKLSQFRDRIDLVRHRTQGDYNTPMPLKGKWYGRIFMLFRTWLPRAIEERFGSENKYLETKGRMLTLRDAFTAKGLKGAGKFTLNTTLVTLAKLTNLPLIGEHIGKNPLASNAIESYEKYLKEIGLSDLDVENMRAQIAEFRMIILAVGLGMVFHALAGGGDDDPEVNFTVNLLQRVYQDLTFFIFPSSSFAIIKDPIPIMKTIMDGTEAINASINYMINPEKDTYKKGFRKGRSKTAKEWNELIPVLSAWNSTEATYNQIFGENTYKYTKK